jgi:hypothetical protein
MPTYSSDRNYNNFAHCVYRLFLLYTVKINKLIRNYASLWLSFVKIQIEGNQFNCQNCYPLLQSTLGLYSIYE